MRRLYDILFTLLFWLASPYYFVRLRRRGDWVEGFWQRFGKYAFEIPSTPSVGPRIWIHAVSVGEVNTCLHFLTALERRLPQAQLILSTTTTTGMAELRRRLPAHIRSIYFPIDRRKYVKRALGTIRPDAVVLMEREIWPNFIWHVVELGRPLFLINARISDRSFRVYRRFPSLFRPLYEAFTAVAVQTDRDAEKLRRLGCKAGSIHILGSLKFDAASQQDPSLVDSKGLLRRAGAEDRARILVGGSTHPGEEELLAEVFLRLRVRHPDLFLVLVPRHFERSTEAARDLGSVGLRHVRWSELEGSSSQRQRSECLLVDTTGQLRSFYREAEIVFIGKSLTAIGGQNPIEPAAFGKPVVFGPNMQNFRDVSRMLLESGGAVQVQDASELETALDRLLKDDNALVEVGRNARRAVENNLGATERTVDLVVSNLSSATGTTRMASEG